MPLSVSVVTPSYNQGRFIERTIQSVLSQAPDLEYVVFDGGSTDQTVEILRRYESRLRWSSEKDRGQADAVNKGLRSTSGDVIGWLNSDDIYYPGAIDAVSELFAADPDVDFIYGDGNHIDENDGIIEPYPTEPWDIERLKETCYLCQPAVFFRRRAVAKFGVLNENLHFCLDYEYWLRAASQGARFVRMQKVLAGSRLYAETKTLGSRLKCHREINDMMRSHLKRVPDRWLFNYAHAMIDGKGIPREDLVRFPLWVSAASLYAAIRWNHAVSTHMLRTTWKWMGNATYNTCKRRR
jgi:glycosyltransferase involved in cell wall biosynthesis